MICKDVEARREYEREYRRRNREKMRGYQVLWQKNNREKLKTCSSEHYQRNRKEVNARSALWRENNREKANAHRRVYYRRNREGEIAKSILWRKNNPEKAKAIVDRLRPRHREDNRIREHNRRAIGIITRKIYQQVYEENIKLFGTLTCYLCKKPIIFGDDSLEHKDPISRGGTNDYNNLAIAHGVCNSRKGAKTEAEYRSQYA